MHHEANADISTFYLRGFAMTTTLSCTGPQIQHAKDSAAQEQERSRWYVSMKPETGFLCQQKNWLVMINAHKMSTLCPSDHDHPQNFMSILYSLTCLIMKHVSLNQGTATEERPASWGRHLGDRISRRWHIGPVKNFKTCQNPQFILKKGSKMTWKKSAFYRLFPPFSRYFPPFSGFEISVFFSHVCHVMDFGMLKVSH